MTTNAETKATEDKPKLDGKRHPELQVPKDFPLWLTNCAHTLALTGRWDLAAEAGGEGVNVPLLASWSEREPYRETFSHARALGSASLMAAIEGVVIDMAMEKNGTVSLRAAALLRNWHGGSASTADRIGLSSLLNAGKGDSGNPAAKKTGKKPRTNAAARKTEGGEGGTSS